MGLNYSRQRRFVLSSNTCVRCSAIIPSGRNYCAPHYQEALLEYEEAREIYEISYQNYLAEVEEWNEMSVEERNVYHKHAESESLSTISVVAGLSIGALAWFLDDGQSEWWVYVAITAVITGMLVVLKRFFARLIRGLLAGLMYGLGLGVVVFFGLIFLGVADETVYASTTLLFLAGILWGLWKEIRGAHHSYGGPEAPSEPTMPEA
jgi:predicted nucleic acid-binding Zn ribbon protein